MSEPNQIESNGRPLRMMAGIRTDDSGHVFLDVDLGRIAMARLTPTQARDLAKTLLDLADRIDGGVPNGVVT